MRTSSPVRTAAVSYILKNRSHKKTPNQVQLTYHLQINRPYPCLDCVLAVELGASSVKLFGDSELLVKPINGLTKVKKEGLKPLHAGAKELIAKINSVEVQYLPRAKNKEADALANKEI